MKLIITDNTQYFYVFYGVDSTPTVIESDFFCD